MARTRKTSKEALEEKIEKIADQMPEKEKMIVEGRSEEKV